MTTDTLTAPHAAQQTGVSDVYVRHLCAAGKIPGAVRTDAGHWLIPAASLGHIAPAEPGGEANHWTVHEVELLGTDTDTNVGLLIGRSAEAVRYMRTRDGIPPFPRMAPLEQQIPRMTTTRLREIVDLVAAEIARRAENKE
ncbi:hypothetical protein [Desulfolutivibrio sulfodismutans]|uniref:hypothetical protein n=1 Tax=Desulfolutivibrio sulfodismutans TaxID=63561 RepID=UPI00159D1CB8|nr:hypothetical protein [Desulfolutivibrio sulfodismutans]